MKLHILSDLHVNFWNNRNLLSIQDVGADVIVVAGDVDEGTRGIEFLMENLPKDKPTLYVPGNHEYYGYNLDSLDEKLKQMAKGSNIHVLNNDSVEIDGILFIGATLWTDFSLFGNPIHAIQRATSSMNDFRYIDKGNGQPIDAMDLIVRHTESKNFIADKLIENRTKKAVVITHHAPSIESINPIYRRDVLSAAFASNLRDFICYHENIALWIHGHTHYNSDYAICETRVVSNQAGYFTGRWENPQFDPQFTIHL